jgi:hypothetical protein
MTPHQLRILRAELQDLERARRLASQLRQDSQTAADRAVVLEGTVYRLLRAVKALRGTREKGRP